MPSRDEPKQVYPTPEDCDYKKPPVEFTFERRMRFLYEYRRTGLLYLAASLVGVSTSTVHTARKNDKDFDAAVKEAKELFVDEVLVAEAVRRAVNGVTEPIIGGKFRDEVVAEKQVYSDALLSMLIRGARQEYRDGQQGGPGKYDQQPTGAVVVPASPKSPQEWEAQVSGTLPKADGEG